jgi:hypothetical protein
MRSFRLSYALTSRAYFDAELSAVGAFSSDGMELVAMRDRGFDHSIIFTINSESFGPKDKRKAALLVSPAGPTALDRVRGGQSALGTSPSQVFGLLCSLLCLL